MSKKKKNKTLKNIKVLITTPPIPLKNITGTIPMTKKKITNMKPSVIHLT